MKRVKTILLDLAFMAAGAVVYAVSVNAFTSPNNIAPGGVTGIATMLNYLFSTPIGLVAFLINIPIILWAVVEIGYKLVAKSVVAILLSSVAIDLLAPHRPLLPGEHDFSGPLRRPVRGIGPVPHLPAGGHHRRYGHAGPAAGPPEAPPVHGQADAGGGRPHRPGLRLCVRQH